MWGAAGPGPLLTLPCSWRAPPTLWSCLHAHPTGGPSPPAPGSPATRTVPAVTAHEAFGALAHVALVRVHTGTAVLAGGREAGVGHGAASCERDGGHQSSSTLGVAPSALREACSPDFRLPLPESTCWGRMRSEGERPARPQAFQGSA